MKMPFSVTYLDGRSFDVVATPKDLVNYERQFGKSVATMSETRSLEAIYYLAWSALHRGGQESGDFDTFLDQVEDVEPVDDEAVDPTPAEPSAPSAL